MRVHHIAIQVPDLERAARFYGDVIGLAEVRRQPHSIWLDAGGVVLMLEKCAGSGLAPPWKSDVPGLHLLALAIEPARREEWRARLTAAGLTIEAETRFTIYARDPFGNRFGLSHYPDEAG